ncbi:MAG: type IX secretion system membrane protein PorP/SprF [Prevotellaceae bacterium]|jgi:type IX secretion system PorP/SprF family membrane protein|nr:type IX secretion system membrane protein PorP/SprF [Prevotellaceae bacterium]
MKKTTCIAVFLMMVAATVLRAQHDSQITQHMFSQVLVNPACAGNGEMLDATFIQRSQYMGFKGAPSVWSLGVSTPFMLFDANHGAVVAVTGDKIGNFDNMSFSAGYAYRHKFSSVATLGVGISLGGVSYKLVSPSEWNAYSDDPAVPQREESSSTGFDMGLGAYYDERDFYVSFACRHLNQPRVLTVNSGDKTLLVKRTFYLSGGYRWQMPNEKFELDPSAMLMFTSLAKPQLEFGANVFYLKRYWGGLSYRIGDALGALAGITVSEAFRMGVAYEYPLSKLIGTNGGSLEIFVSYAFELKLTKKERKYKSIRFL